MTRGRSGFPHDTPLLEFVAGAGGRHDERLALEQLIRALPPEQREVLHLKAIEKLRDGFGVAGANHDRSR